MAKTKDIVGMILEIVAEETEINSIRILSGERSAEVVDARHIVVILLAKIGVYTSRIASSMNMTSRNVQYIITTFDNRISCNKPLRNTYERIKKTLRSSLEINSLQS